MISDRLDAKKKAKVIKPLFLKDTKANSVINALAFGGICVVVAFGAGTLWVMKSYDLKLRPKLLDKIFDSKEAKMSSGRFMGYIPQRFDLREKFSREYDNPNKSQD